MSFLLLVASSALAAPGFENSSFIDVSDYPDSFILQDKSVAVVLDVHTNLTGKIWRCEVVSFVGDRRLANTACRIAKRKRIKPARDSNGEATYGARRTIVRMMVHGTSQGDEVQEVSLKPDFDFIVKKLESVEANSLDISLSVKISAVGRIVDCSGASEAVPSGYFTAACDNIQNTNFPLYSDPNGTPVSYVRNVTVRFAEDGS